MRVRVDIKFLPFDPTAVDAEPLINPVRDVGKGGTQKCRVKIARPESLQRKVEVFGKACRFQKSIS